MKNDDVEQLKETQQMFKEDFPLAHSFLASTVVILKWVIPVLLIAFGIYFAFILVSDQKREKNTPSQSSTFEERLEQVRSQ